MALQHNNQLLYNTSLSSQVDASLFEQSPIALIICNNEGSILQANALARRCFGLHEHVKSAKKLWLTFAFEGVKSEIQSWMQSASEEVQDLIIRVKSPRVSLHWFKVSKRLLENHSLLLSFTDIDDLKKIEDDLQKEQMRYQDLATFDPLTKLPNRMLLSDRMTLALSHAKRNRKCVSICLIDLDGFKAVNDTYGHEAGDSVLVEAAKRMQHHIRSEDTVARLGGDEFVVILTDLQKCEDCVSTLYRLLNTLGDPYMVDGNKIKSISASIGVTHFPDDNETADILLRHADMAMYLSKNSGKNRFTFFDVNADKKVKANYKTIKKLQKALAKGEFRLLYQPKVNAISKQIEQLEALSRWEHPLLGTVSPNEFLPLVQNDDALCDAFDEWVLREAFTQLQQWHAEGLHVKVCINLSTRQFRRRDFLSWLDAILNDYDDSKSLLEFVEFEIVETAALENLKQSYHIVKECKKEGITFALDDFGTGYSSMMHLKELPIDTIKIDKNFVAGMLNDSANMVIVQAVIALGNAFDISVTAEGAENIEQILTLLELGCDDIQGFGIARPMPAEDVSSFIKRFEPDPRWQIISHTLPSKTDFELLLADTNHSRWIEAVIESFSCDLDAEMALPLNPKTCRFGEWTDKVRFEYSELIPSFKRLDALHQEIHRYAQQLLNQLITEKRVINEAEKKKLMQYGAEMSQLIEVLREEVDRIKRSNSFIDKILHKRGRHGR